MLIAIEYHDINKIKKLNTLKNASTFWDDVRRFTKYVTSGHSLERWQVLAENRFKELEVATHEKNLYK